MTVADGGCNVGIRVGSQLMEKMLLNIPPDWLRRVIGEIATAAGRVAVLEPLMRGGGWHRGSERTSGAFLSA